MGLRTYKAKRDFARTPEPAGKPAPKTKQDSQLSFVIQKHAARRLHYDFRLEMEGVLKSWAVPKGIPYQKGEKRLAVQVEDHPLDYGDFEGAIAEGNYGAGTVMVWDKGTYEVSGGDPLGSLEKGKIHMTLHGDKLNGEWTLVRMRALENEDKAQWLLIKSGMDLPPLSVRRDDQSVLSQRSMAEIKAHNDAQWASNRRSSPQHARYPRIRKAEPGTNALDSLPPHEPAFVSPMKAKLVDQLPQGPGWVYEIKFDGFRALGIKQGQTTQLLSRNELSLADRFPEIARALGKLPCQTAVLDGEIVAVDEKGRFSFQLLQNAAEQRPPIVYYLFDILNLEKKDLTALPLTERKTILQSLIEDVGEPIRFSASIDSDPHRLLAEVKRRGLEGVVAKRRDSHYEPGRRSGAWVKLKCINEQEFVIGGYTAPQGTRKYFGAILVGYYEKGRLEFASKVGTGFDSRLLRNLHDSFQKIIRPDSPFAGAPVDRRGLTPAERKTCTWVEPELVCQVRFTEWTRDGGLRNPAFKGLRPDKNPKEVVRERPG